MQLVKVYGEVRVYEGRAELSVITMSDEVERRVVDVPASCAVADFADVELRHAVQCASTLYGWRAVENQGWSVV